MKQKIQTYVNFLKSRIMQNDIIHKSITNKGKLQFKKIFLDFYILIIFENK